MSLFVIKTRRQSPESKALVGAEKGREGCLVALARDGIRLVRKQLL